MLGSCCYGCVNAFPLLYRMALILILTALRVLSADTYHEVPLDIRCLLELDSGRRNAGMRQRPGFAMSATRRLGQTLFRVCRRTEVLSQSETLNTIKQTFRL